MNKITVLLFLFALPIMSMELEDKYIVHGERQYLIKDFSNDGTPLISPESITCQLLAIYNEDNDGNKTIFSLSHFTKEMLALNNKHELKSNLYKILYDFLQQGGDLKTAKLGIYGGRLTKDDDIIYKDNEVTITGNIDILKANKKLVEYYVNMAKNGSQKNIGIKNIYNIYLLRLNLISTLLETYNIILIDTHPVEYLRRDKRFPNSVLPVHDGLMSWKSNIRKLLDESGINKTNLDTLVRDIKDNSQMYEIVFRDNIFNIIKELVGGNNEIKFCNYSNDEFTNFFFTKSEFNYQRLNSKKQVLENKDSSLYALYSRYETASSLLDRKIYQTSEKLYLKALIEFKKKYAENSLLKAELKSDYYGVLYVIDNNGELKPF